MSTQFHSEQIFVTGNRHFKPYVSCDPHVVQLDLLTIPAQLLIIASDGIWNHVQPEEAAGIGGKSEQICKTLCDLAIERESNDNIAIIVCHLRESA